LRELHLLHQRDRLLDRVRTIGSDLRPGSRVFLAACSHRLLLPVVRTSRVGSPTSPNYRITSRPIERAVPAMVLTADSSESQFRSGIFSLAISSTCFAVTVPTLFLFGSADPFAILAARFSSTGAGGGLVMKVYD